MITSLPSVNGGVGSSVPPSTVNRSGAQRRVAANHDRAVHDVVPPVKVLSPSSVTVAVSSTISEPVPLMSPRA